jgi:hypothetical protein
MPAYLDLLLHPLKIRESISGGWTGSRGKNTESAFGPLMVYHLHFFDLGSRNKKRPVIFQLGVWKSPYRSPFRRYHHHWDSCIPTVFTAIVQHRLRLVSLDIGGL